MKTKICSKCKKEKTLDQFYKGDDKNGLHYWCKSCFDEKARSYRNLHKKQSQIYRKKHKKEMTQYQQDHRIEIAQRKRINYLKNKETILEKSKIYKRNKRKNDINYKIVCNLRTRINLVLKRNIKSESTIVLLGCSIEKLKQHLEKQFKKGMKQWHIDHIKSCASYDLSKESEQKKCFHYSNLQPLWAEENLRKHDC